MIEKRIWLCEVFLAYLLVGLNQPAYCQTAVSKPQPVPSTVQETSNIRVSTTSKVEFGPYMADLTRRIKRAWFPPKGMESKTIVVSFKVNKNGQLSDLKLVTSTGPTEAAKAALQAVQNASPFRALPQESGDDIDVQLRFDYNLFSGGGTGGRFRNF
jgi:TonB family protein